MPHVDQAELDDLRAEVRRHEERPHGFVQEGPGVGRWVWVCGWCGALAEVRGRDAKRSLLDHLWDQHGIDTHTSRIGAPREVPA